MWLEAVLSSHNEEYCLQDKVQYNEDYGNIPHFERKELLQATLNVIQDDFPNEAIVNIIEFDQVG